MSVRGDKAYELFLSGYNCTQAVIGAFADVIGMDFDTAVRFASGFGGGMGRLREVCGTFSGAVIVVNALYGYSDPKNVQAKAELYSRIQELAAQFRRDNGSIICKELLRAFQTGRLANTGSKNGRVLQEASLSGALPIFSEHA